VRRDCVTFQRAGALSRATHAPPYAGACPRRLRTSCPALGSRRRQEQASLTQAFCGRSPLTAGGLTAASLARAMVTVMRLPTGPRRAVVQFRLGWRRDDHGLATRRPRLQRGSPERGGHPHGRACADRGQPGPLALSKPVAGARSQVLISSRGGWAVTGFTRSARSWSCCGVPRRSASGTAAPRGCRSGWGGAGVVSRGHDTPAVPTRAKRPGAEFGAPGPPEEGEGGRRRRRPPHRGSRAKEKAERSRAGAATHCHTPVVR
jgi:hypothetical protein